MKSWDFEYAYIKGYSINAHDKYSGDLVVDPQGNINQTALPSTGVRLDQQLTQLFIKAMLAAPPEEIWVAACFYPHHGFVFFDENDKIVSHISICFACNTYSYSRDSNPFDHINFPKLLAIAEKLGLQTTFDWDQA